MIRSNKLIRIAIVLLALCWASCTYAQDTEPRRWAHLPTGVNVVGMGYGYIDGDIFFDPLLLIEDATFEMHKAGLVYMRTFGVLGRSARLDFTLPYIAGRWEGTVDSEFVKFRRRGPGDARMRFSMLLYGGPAETLQEFVKSEKSNTVVGAAVAVTMPTGKYNKDRLINMGANRWVVRPQIGVTHTRGKWTGEITGSVYLYADNKSFWQDTHLETDPLFALQGHLIYTFRPGLWTSLSTAYGWGGEATVNGDAKKNPSGNWLTALSFGFPVTSTQGVKIAWIRGRSQKPTGADLDSIALGYSIMF